MGKEMAEINTDLAFMCVRQLYEGLEKEDALTIMKPVLNEEYYNNLIFF